MTKTKTIGYIAGAGLLLAGTYHFIKKDKKVNKIKRHIDSDTETAEVLYRINNDGERKYYDVTDLYQEYRKTKRIS